MVEGRIPPSNNDAEQSVIGAILIDKDAIVSVAEFLRPEHFYNPSNSLIFEAIFKLYEERKPIDLITITTVLKKNKMLEKVGGTEYLSSLANLTPTSANVEHYGRIIQEEYMKRQMIKAAASINELAFNDQTEVKNILDQAEQQIFAISQANLKRDFIAVKEALAESFDRLDALSKRAGGLRGVSTGFLDLDNKLAGMQESNLLILAARPGQGKTALALNMAQHASVVNKEPVGFFSLEMSKEEIVDRMLVAQADVDAWRLKTGRLSDEDFTKLSDAMGELAEAPLYIDDTPGISIMEMRTKARRLKAQHGLKLIIVDYLQLIDCGRRYDSRVTEVSMVSQSLKNLARELKVPVLSVSQLSRAVEVRGTRIPQLADLRESGAIEQDADVVMFLYRPEEPEGTKPSEQVQVKLLIAKHRNGPLGEIDFIFKGDRLKFYGLEKKREK